MRRSGFRNEASAIEVAVAAWGGGERSRVPEWVLALATECDQSSQRQVARKLDYNQSVISQVVANKYPHAIDGLREAVAEKIMIKPAGGDTQTFPRMRENASADAAIASWGGGDKSKVPQWIMALATACDDHTQTRVAKQLGYSPSVVSQVLSNKYAGDMTRVREAVGAHILKERIPCPAEGTMPRRRCLELQERAGPPYASGWHARIWRHCQTCPNFRGPRK